MPAQPTDPLDLLTRPSAQEPDETPLTRLLREQSRQRARIDLLEEAVLATVPLTEALRARLAGSEEGETGGR